MLYRLLIIFLCFFALISCDRVASQKDIESGIRSADTLLIKSAIGHAVDILHQFPDSSVVILRQTLQHSRETGYHHGFFYSLYNIAFILYSEGKKEEALDAYATALHNCDTSAKREDILLADILNDMGSIYADMGEYRQSLEYYYRAERAYKKHGAKTQMRGYIYNNIATVLMELKEYKQAKEYLSKAEHDALQEKSYQLLLSVYTNGGEILMHEHNYSESEVFLLKAVDIAEQYATGSHEHIMSLTVTGLLYCSNHNPRKAIHYLREAERLSSVHEKTIIFLALGSALHQMNNPRQAITYTKFAIENIGDNTDIGYLLDSYKALSEYYSTLHQDKDAYDNLLKYTILNDSIKGKEVQENINDLNIQYQTIQKDKELAQQQILLERKDKRFWLVSLGSSLLVLAIVVALIIMFLIFRHRRRLDKEKIAVLEKERQVSSLRDTITGEELERKRIAQELHDGIGGMLAALKAGLSTLQYKQKPDDQKDFDNVLQLLDETSDEVRKTAHNLMPNILERLGLAGTLEYYLLQESITRPALQTELLIHGDVNKTPGSFQLIVYRIVQQLVHNIVQHASATHAMVQLNRDEENNVFTILAEDNGRGFDTNEAKKGIGLQSITDRVYGLRGALHIQSGTGKGTLVAIEFNLAYINTIR